MASQVITTQFEASEFRTILSECVSETVRREIASLISPSAPPKQILTRQETAEYLSISLQTLHDYTKRGVIQAYRLGYKVRYKLADVESALDKIKTRA